MVKFLKLDSTNVLQAIAPYLRDKHVEEKPKARRVLKRKAADKSRDKVKKRKS